MKEKIQSLYKTVTTKLEEFNAYTENLAKENPKSGFLIAVVIAVSVSFFALGLIVPTVDLLVQWLTTTAMVISRLAVLALAALVFWLSCSAFFAVITKSNSKAKDPAPTATTPAPAESSPTSPS